MSARIVCLLLALFLGAQQSWAQGFPYAADINGDDEINILDLIQVRNSLGTSPQSSGAFCCDVTRDGSVNILDMIAVRNYLNCILPQREFLFDFATPSSPLAPGAIRVAPGTDYDPAVGYGWCYPPDRSYMWAEDRDWEDPLGRDLIAGDQLTTFRVDLPAGSYEVYVTAEFVPGLTTMRFGIKGGKTPDAYYHSQSLGGTMDYLRPTSSQNLRRFLDVGLEEDYIAISFDGKNAGPWAVSTIEIKSDITDLILHDVHVDDDRHYDFSPPTRDSNLSFVSQKFADYQQDWDYLANWYQDVVDDTMTTGDKVEAIVQKLFDTLTLAATPAVHAVDVLVSGKGVCEHRATAFQYLMHTLGLPTRGLWLWVVRDAGHAATVFSDDPLSYTGQNHTAAEVFYEGRWHFYNANYGQLYDCSIVELLADPTTEPALAQESRPGDPFYFTQVKEVMFLMDMNKWRYSGSSTQIVQYTPQTARTLYRDSPAACPFKLQARRRGFSPHEGVLPIRRFYGYSSTSAPHHLYQGDALRQEVYLSPLEGIIRLSNQLNVRWNPAHGAGQLRFMLTVNGEQREIVADVEPHQADYEPVILEAPAGCLLEGTNVIDIELLEAGELRIPYACQRQDADLVFRVVQVASAAHPGDFQPLARHLFWNVDVVYDAPPVRSSPGEITLDLSNVRGLEKSLFMLPHFEPTEILGGESILDFQLLPDWSFDSVTLVIEKVPSFVRVATSNGQ